jgi:hypothetical protein
MTKQQIFNALAFLEQETFYNHSKEENLVLRQALEAYAKATNTHN